MKVEVETHDTVFEPDTDCPFRYYVRCHGDCCKHPQPPPDDELCEHMEGDCPLVKGETVVRLVDG
jgi:hypothetical protein